MLKNNLKTYVGDRNVNIILIDTLVSINIIKLWLNLFINIKSCSSQTNLIDHT